jgi:copper resistance protein B
MSMRLFAAVLVAMAGTAGPALAQMADMPGTRIAPVSSRTRKPLPADPHRSRCRCHFDPAIMARARKATIHDAGGMPFSMLLVDQAEWRPEPAESAGLCLERQGLVGWRREPPRHRIRGRGPRGRKAERAEIQVGWLHALDPWFNVRAGVRQDLGRGPIAPMPR